MTYRLFERNPFSRLNNGTNLNYVAEGEKGGPFSITRTEKVCCVGNKLSITGKTQSDVFFRVESEQFSFGVTSKPTTIQCVPHGGAGGDPHITKWDGLRYDYHGECDLVLLNAPSFGNGNGLTIHIRTKIVKMYSYIAKAAIRIGEDTLEIGAEGEYSINGYEYGDLANRKRALPPNFPMAMRRVRSRAA